MTPTRNESGFRHRLRVRLGPTGPLYPLPYTRASVLEAKRKQELEREKAAIEAAIPTNRLYMVQGD
jgi:hypothetical protein